MSCGRDRSFIEEQKLLNSIEEDYLNIISSKDVLLSISLDIKDSYIQMLTEQQQLNDKMRMYLLIQNIVLRAILAEMRNGQLTDEQDEALDEKHSTMEELDEIYYSVRDEKGEFEAKQKQLVKPMRETEKEWMNEPVPDERGLSKMSSKEREYLVKLWKDREAAAEQGQSIFDELKGEWDSMKEEFDMDVMECLRGVARLKDSP